MAGTPQPKAYLQSCALPLAMMENHNSWCEFADAFRSGWRTDERQVRKSEIEQTFPDTPKLLRLTARWTSSATSVFDRKGPGVALATFAGIPWLLWILGVG